MITIRTPWVRFIEKYPPEFLKEKDITLILKAFWYYSNNMKSQAHEIIYAK